MNARSLFTVLLLCFAMAGIGQNNFTGFNYQAVVRNAIGDPLPNQAIAVRVQMNPTGSNGYTERHTVTTDANGQIKLVMGEGTPVVGSTVPTFAGLDWTSGAVMNYTVSVDITGGTTYTALGSGQFKSVPFALRSLTSGGGSAVGWAQTGNDLSNTNSGNVGIGTPTPTFKLDVNGTARVNGTNGAILALTTTGDGTNQWQVQSSAFNNGNFGVVRYAPGADEAKSFMITSAGNFGLGTASPLSKLDVEGGAAIGAAYSGTNAAPANGLLVQGNVGIGTTATVNKLDVEGGAAIGATYSGTNAAPANGLLVEGNVGIGINNPTAKLDVRGASPTGNAAFITDGYVKFCALPGNASGNVSMGTVNGYGNTKLTIQSDQTYALHSTNTAGGNAGYFQGNVAVTGTLSKGGGSFKIDHPLDPTNKFLYHSFVESPDMMNVYNGNVVLDGSGAATVALPDYFQALNKDYRYQLTPIGAPGPGLYVAQKVANGVFTIAGGTPGAEVSWQVTGIRQDAFANENRIPNTVDKKGVEVGKYLHPSAFGLDRSMGIDYRTNGE